MRYVRLLSGLFILVGFSSVAYASGDYGCGGPKGTVYFKMYDSCNSVPFLSPGNDSRLNLELLLIDAGKLTGRLRAAEYQSTQADAIWLNVPFNLEDWQPGEPGSADPKPGGGGSAEASNDYAEGEGSRCTSNGAGMEAFNKALAAAAGLPADEEASLKAARIALVPGCSSASQTGWKAPEGIHSAVGHDFATYVAGTSEFYAGDFIAARKDFASLGNSANPWLKETSRYMVGRTLLNGASQAAFGEWGQLDLGKVTKGNLPGAEDAFNEYLHDYPSGTYAVSARGLLRRVYWLGNDQTKLADAFDRALTGSEKGANNVSALGLVQEADAKLLSAVDSKRIQSPQFLAIVDLMRMRSGNSDSDGSMSGIPLTLLTLAELESQKDRFVSQPKLYTYLLAVFHLFVDNKPEQALASLPDTPNADMNYFAFGQQTLRALAMEATKQFDQERKLLLRMLPLAKLPLEAEQLQLMLARLDEHMGHLERVFAPDSPIRDRAIRTILVEHSASPEILRQRIKDPKEDAFVVDAALYALLYKELTQGRYQAFQSDLALLQAHLPELLAPFAVGESKDAGYRCRSLRQVAATLQRDGNDAQSLNCVGELVRNHGIHYDEDRSVPESELGGDRSLFPGKEYSRMDSYLKVIANGKADSDARAYALYRAMRCYAPSGYSECGKQEIAKSTRKQWFQTLHKDYAGSAWAKASKFYW